MKKSFLVVFLGIFISGSGQKNIDKATINILYSPGHPLNTFIPSQTFGAAFDGHETGEINAILRPENIKAMRSSGYGPLTYRLRTELANEVWHWNPKGIWSDEKNKQGYWVSSDDTNSFISLSHSYRLPRRGNTFDQADNDGYSRIDDGDEKTFWKSNPYLDEYYSDTKKEKHPQWVVIDLGKEQYINAIKISWGDPYATSFTIDYASPSIYDYFTHFGYYETNDTGIWKSFSKHDFNNQTGSIVVLKLSDTLTKVRFIRIRMTASSHTSLASSKDVRDSLGFSIREIYVGKSNSKNIFTDLIHHGKKNSTQSPVYVSSTDCWHRAIDINKNTEQVGIDRIYKSGLTNNLPALIPVGVLYDNPENALALINYLHKKSFAVEGIEMGEEADGQAVSPEDYASLYYQWAKKIKNVYPDLKLGGPSLETIIVKWEDELFSTQTWMNRFIEHLKDHNAIDDFNFFSFEWYPYDNICDSAAPQLRDAPGFFDRAMKDIFESQIPPKTPMYISEYGYSAFSGRSEVTIEGALMNADIVGKFLELGGSKTYLYGLEPSQLEQNGNCNSFGNNMLFGRDDQGKILYNTATYYGLKMLTTNWINADDKPVDVFSAQVGKLKTENDIACYPIITDNAWSILIINKNPTKKYNVDINISNETKDVSSSLIFPITIYQYSNKQYVWKEDGIKSFPSKNLSPEKQVLKNAAPIILPAYSITIIKEKTQSEN